MAVLTILQIVCVAYVARALWLDRKELVRALDLSLFGLILLVVLMALAHLQRAFEFTYMLRRLGVNEPFWDGFWLTGAGFLLNHLPLNAGFVMRAALLKSDHALSYTSYVSLSMVNAAVNVAVGAGVGMIASATLFFGSGRGGLALLVFTAIVVACVGLVFVPRRFAPGGGNYLARRLATFLEGVALIRGRGLGILWLALLAVIRLLGVAARLWICFDALGASVSPLAALLLAWGVVLFTLVNITPGNLGLRELVLSLASAELGSTQMLGMAAASMDRVVLLAYVVAAGVPGLYSIRRRGLFQERSSA